jgi:hypothetical protein
MLRYGDEGDPHDAGGDSEEVVCTAATWLAFAAEAFAEASHIREESVVSLTNTLH